VCDNFGYIRQLADARERAGGNGVYHLSNWGRPHDCLWLESSAPALTWEEMTTPRRTRSSDLFGVHHTRLRDASSTVSGPSTATDKGLPPLVELPVIHGGGSTSTDSF
jgi:Glycosyl hydrolase family 115